MRKRSKYRPKGVILNPMAYVMEGMVPVAKHGSFLVDLKIKNHAAMSALTHGVAVRQDIDVLINALNVAEALYRMGFGREYKDVVQQGLQALHDVAVRGATTGRFILTGPEMTNLNLVIELHDAQLDLCTVKDMERAVALVHEEYRQKKMRPVIKKDQT